jgi:hypothetical protein
MRWTGHSGGLLKPAVIDSVVLWLGGSTQSDAIPRRHLLIATMIISGLAAGVSLLRLLPAKEHKAMPQPSAGAAIVFYVIAAFVATGFLSFVPLFSWLRLYATDFLIGVLFLTGLFLLLRFRPGFRTSSRNLFIALLSMLFLIGLMNIVGSELADFMLSGARWWRFPLITLLGLPIFLVDERVLRGRSSPFLAALLALITRAMLGALVVTAGLTVNRDAAFLLLLMHAVVLFWMVLWFLGDAVRRRTDALSAALFSALIQGWVFSALFVTT